MSVGRITASCINSSYYNLYHKRNTEYLYTIIYKLTRQMHREKERSSLQTDVATHLDNMQVGLVFIHFGLKLIHIASCDLVG